MSTVTCNLHIRGRLRFFATRHSAFRLYVATYLLLVCTTLCKSLGRETSSARNSPSIDTNLNMPHFTSESERSPIQPLHRNNVDSPHSTADDHETRSTQRTRVKNRRHRYLELHPEYFKDPSLEIAEPLLYHRLINRFKTAQEREIAGKARLSSQSPSTSTFAHILESSLTRSEANLHALQHPDPAHPVSYTRTPAGEIFARELDPEDPEPMTRAEGWTQWCEILRRRFVEGRDGDFDYVGVDSDEELDFWEERERSEAWILSESEEVLRDETGRPRGETGVLDY
nr:hypothetical protein CFP56_31604 [Quercus suber]